MQCLGLKHLGLRMFSAPHTPPFEGLRGCDTYTQAFLQGLLICYSDSFGTYVKIGTIQRRLAWPLRKDDTMNAKDVTQISLPT